MKPRDNEDKHRTRWAGGAKPIRKRHKLDSRSKESAVVEQCLGILKKSSPTSSCSHNSRTQRHKPNTQKTPVYHQGSGSEVSPRIARKLATYEDLGEEIHEDKNEVKLNSRWSRSKSEIVGRDYFTDQLDMVGSGSDQELEFKQPKHLNWVPQREDIFNEQATITSPSSAISTPISVRSDMNLFKRRKYVKDLVEDHGWLVEKIIQLKRELNIIVQKMKEVKDQHLLTGSKSTEIMKHLSRHGTTESVCCSNNCLQCVRLDNKSRELSSPTLNNSETSSSKYTPCGSSCNTPTGCSRKLTVLTGHHSRQNTISLPHDISQVSESTSELCSSTDQPVRRVFRLVQYLFLIVLVIGQCVVQFVTMSR